MRDMEVKTHARTPASGQKPPPLGMRPGSTSTPQALPIVPATIPDLYAMACIGDCMEPIVANGTTLAFDKLSPCRPGDIVVVWKRPDLIRAGEPPAVVKRLLHAIPSFVNLPYVGHPNDEVRPVLAVEMLRPRQTLWFSCETVIAVHRCLGAVERLANSRAAMRQDLIENVRAGRV